jgi:formylglycine-generating enzyme required for sulfatase activity
VNEDEKHSVILTQGFYLGKYEVTRQEYLKVMGTNPRKLKGDKVLIERVS